MKILSLEFSSSQRSAAVLADDAVFEVVQTGVEASDALGMTETVLRDSGIERAQIGMVVIGLGPGSYNGIRAAIALAQGWQLARPVRACGISSVECVAEQARDQGFRGLIYVAVDAQRDEFYFGGYQISAEACREEAPLQIVGPAEIVRIQAAGGAVIGPDVAGRIPDSRDVFPRAATLARLARQRGEVALQSKLEPIYLRETAFVKASSPPRTIPSE